MWARRTWKSSSYSRPQTSTSSARWVISRPRLRASVAQQLELGRGQVDLLAVAADACGRRGRSRGPSATIVGSAALRRGAAQRRLAAGRPARAGRTAWSRSRRRRPPAPDLASSSPTAERTMIGISLHSRSRRVTSTPSMSGSIRSRIAASGGFTAARSSASSPRRRGHRLEAGVAEDHPQRPQDLRLVVADEDPRPRRSRPRLRGSAKADDEAACPGPAATRPRSRRRWPRRSPWRSPGRGRSPPPLAAPARGRTARRSARARSRGCPGPGRRRGPRSAARPAASAPGPARRSPWTTAFSSRLAKARSSWAASARSGGRSASSASRTGSPRAPSDSPRRLEQPRPGRPARGAARRARSPAARRRAGSRPGARAAGPRSTTASLSSWRSSAVDARRAERGAGGDDRGQRRAQVVRDRAQQRGLQLVAAAQRLGLDRLGLHAGRAPRASSASSASARSASSRRARPRRRGRGPARRGCC